MIPRAMVMAYSEGEGMRSLPSAGHEGAGSPSLEKACIPCMADIEGSGTNRCIFTFHMCVSGVVFYVSL